MKFEVLINSVFEREAEQYRAEIPAFHQDIPVLPGVKKYGKERYGSLIISIIIVVLISVFSLRTGIFENSWLFPWTDMIKLFPEYPGEAFFGFLQAINSSV